MAMTPTQQRRLDLLLNDLNRVQKPALSRAYKIDRLRKTAKGYNQPVSDSDFDDFIRSRDHKL